MALGTRFEAGEAAGSGGALWLSNGTLLASGATLAGNRAPGGLGGAVALAGSSARLVLEGGALQGNFAGKLGGGVAASGGAQVLLLGGGNGGYLLLKGNEVRIPSARHRGGDVGRHRGIVDCYRRCLARVGMRRSNVKHCLLCSHSCICCLRVL